MQQQFTVLLNSLKTCTAGMLACLELERNGLVSRDMTRIEQTTERKNDLSKELEMLETQRADLLAALGYKNDAAGMAACLQKQPNARLLNGLWQEILTNLSACRDHNLTNGGILELGRRQAEQALSILRGKFGDPSIYSSEGNTSPAYGKRDLGKV